MLRLDIGDLEDWTPLTVLATIFGGELPQLQRLSLWFYTYWPHGKFPNLTHMSLHGRKVRPSIDEFLDLLESTPLGIPFFAWSRATDSRTRPSTTEDGFISGSSSSPIYNRFI